jgi:hypothetical protein
MGGADIVERLRDWEPSFAGAAVLGKLHDDAADEIERLRTLIAEFCRDATATLNELKDKDSTKPSASE